MMYDVKHEETHHETKQSYMTRKTNLNAPWKNSTVFRSFDILAGKHMWDIRPSWWSGRISKGATTKDIHWALTGTSNL